MKFIGRLVKWVTIFALGFLIGIYLPKSEFFQDNSDVQIVDNPSEKRTLEFPSNPLDILKPAPESVDYDFIAAKVIELVNELREEKGLNSVKRNAALMTAADVRAVEIETSFSHTRPNGTEPFTVLEEDGINYNYLMAGENLAMATYHKNDMHMAEFIFQGWVDSEDHYATMINPEFVEIGVGVHYDGEILYATQFFGVPYY